MTSSKPFWTILCALCGEGGGGKLATVVIEETKNWLPMHTTHPMHPTCPSAVRYNGQSSVHDQGRVWRVQGPHCAALALRSLGCRRAKVLPKNINKTLVAKAGVAPQPRPRVCTEGGRRRREGPVEAMMRVRESRISCAIFSSSTLLKRSML